MIINELMIGRGTKGREEGDRIRGKEVAEEADELLVLGGIGEDSG